MTLSRGTCSVLGKAETCVCVWGVLWPLCQPQLVRFRDWGHESLPVHLLSALAEPITDAALSALLCCSSVVVLIAAVIIQRSDAEQSFSLT